MDEYIRLALFDEIKNLEKMKEALEKAIKDRRQEFGNLEQEISMMLKDRLGIRQLEDKTLYESLFKIDTRNYIFRIRIPEFLCVMEIDSVVWLDKNFEKPYAGKIKRDFLALLMEKAEKYIDEYFKEILPSNKNDHLDEDACRIDKAAKEGKE